MIRQLEMVALGIAVVLAIAASPANAAPATFMAESYPASINAGATVQHVFSLDNGLPGRCPVVVASAELSSSSAELTYQEAFGSATNMCTYFGLGTEVNWNGCDLVLKSVMTTATADQYVGAAKINCPAGTGPIKIRTTNGVCEIQIGQAENDSLSEVKFENETSAAPKTVIIEPNIAGITYKETVDGIGCPLTHKGETLHNATLTGQTTATATSGGVATGFTLEP